MKCCRDCGLDKALDAFNKHPGCKQGVRPECKDCEAIRLAEYYVKNADRLRAAKLQYYEDNAEAVKAAQAEYAANNRALYAAIGAKYRAAKLQRTPKWLTDLQLDHIKLYYEAAAHMTEIGPDFAVDHIIPLQGEIVSGLHVPWNLQVITKTENSSKSNRLTKDNQ